MESWIFTICHGFLGNLVCVSYESLVTYLTICCLLSVHPSRRARTQKEGAAEAHGEGGHLEPPSRQARAVSHPRAWRPSILCGHPGSLAPAVWHPTTRGNYFDEPAKYLSCSQVAIRDRHLRLSVSSLRAPSEADAKGVRRRVQPLRSRLHPKTSEKA